MQPTSSSRQAYLDWLRIIAIIGVLFFHSAMPYIPEWGWHIKNKETSNALLEMNDFLHRFRMPLLFFISGTVSYFMLQRNTGGGFIGLRFRRLFVPLLVGILIIVPPQVYMERLTQGFKGNYADFYAHMFTTGVYPHGNMSWHHLWFIAYLLVYDILFAPFFVWLISGNGKKMLQKLSWIGNKQYIYLLIIPGTLVHTFLLVWFRQTGDLVHDYGYFFYWLFYVLAGFICIANPLFMDSLERNRRLSLTIAFTGLLIINYLRWNKLEPWIFNDNFRYMPFTYVYMALGGITAWMWVLAIVGYAKRYLNKPRPILAYANQAVYPFYILHQTVIVILTYYLVTVPDGVGLKYTFTVIVTFLISIFIFHLFIRPFAIMRFLFGMKPMAKGEKRGATKEEELIPVQPGMA